MLRIIQLFLLLLIATTTTNAQNCPLCAGGHEANLTKTIGGADTDTPCSAVATDVVDLPLDSCRDLQLLGYRWCDCPEYPEDYFCPMCSGAFVDIPNLYKSIPGADGDTCNDRLFVKASSVESCDEAMKPGFVCGCPDAVEPPCKICGNDMDDDDKITLPDATLTLDGVGSFSCQELVNQAKLDKLTTDQCTKIQAEAFDTCGCVGDNNEPVSSEVEEATISEETNGSGGAKTNATSSITTDVPATTDASSQNTDDNSAAGSNIRSMLAFVATIGGAFLTVF